MANYDSKRFLDQKGLEVLWELIKTKLDENAAEHLSEEEVNGLIETYLTENNYITNQAMQDAIKDFITEDDLDFSDLATKEELEALREELFGDPEDEESTGKIGEIEAAIAEAKSAADEAAEAASDAMSAAGDAQDAAEAAQADVDTLTEKLYGTGEGDDHVNGDIDDLQAADTRMAGDISDLQDAVELLNGDDATEGSVAKVVKDAVNGLADNVYTKDEADAKFVAKVNEPEDKAKVTIDAEAGEFSVITEGDTKTRLEVTAGGTYYTTGSDVVAPDETRLVKDNEVATKGYVDTVLSGALHYEGMTDRAVVEGSDPVEYSETLKQAADRYMNDKGEEPENGAIVIVNDNTGSHQMIYDGTKWDEMGGESNDLYATKIEVTNLAGRVTEAEADIVDNSDAIKALEERLYGKEGTPAQGEEGEEGYVPAVPAVEGDIEKLQDAVNAKVEAEVEKEGVTGTISNAGDKIVASVGPAAFEGAEEGVTGTSRIEIQGDKAYYISAAESAKEGETTFSHNAHEIATKGDIKDAIDALEIDAMTKAEICAICGGVDPEDVDAPKEDAEEPVEP